MRLALIGLLSLVVLTTAFENEEPIEDDEVDEHDAEYEEHYVQKRDVNEDPYDQHIRVKRRCEEESDKERVRRSTDYVRVPRNVHQYEVREDVDDNSLPTSPPYEEMLAASAEHYHRIYAAPGAPAAARYINPEVSAYQYTPSDRSVPSNRNPIVYAYSDPRKNLNPYPREFVPTNNDKYVNVIAHKPIVTFASAPKVSQPLLQSPAVELITAGPPKQVFVSSVNVAPAVIPDAAVVGPAPVPSEPVAASLKKLADDQSGAAGHVHKHHTHVLVHGGGHGGHRGHHAARGGKNVKGFKKNHHVDKGSKSFKKNELHKKQYENADGLKKKHRDHADHKGSHVEEAHGNKGSHFDEKKGHKKGHKTKGYHNKYHKDEFHKEHKFYDDYHKSGEHHRYGKFNAKHASNESGKKKAHHVNSGHDFVDHGKKGYSNKGHVDADHKGYKGNHGHEEHKEHHSEHGKKGGKQEGSEWGYSKKA